jgi:hypothetical protein
MADTFSQTVTGVPADNAQQPSIWDVPDAACVSVGGEQQYMRLGTPFYAKLPDGSKALCVYDTERSIPGVSLVLRRLYP